MSDILAFEKIYKEWRLGLKSMVYRRSKGPIPVSDLEQFRKLERRMDAAWEKVPPFDRATWIAPTKGA